MKKNIGVEIPKNSKVKYEIDSNGKLFVDRILFGTEVYPHNYGFIENTLDWDGDALDGLVISNEAFFPNSIVPTRILGAMEMIDGGETDTKLISVIDVDPRFNHIKTIDDLPKHMLDEIRNFFENYKKLQKKEVIIKGFQGLEFAKEVFKECTDLYNKYNDMDKEKFIAKMKKEHPDKYK